VSAGPEPPDPASRPGGPAMAPGSGRAGSCGRCHLGFVTDVIDRSEYERRVLLEGAAVI